MVVRLFFPILLVSTIFAQLFALIGLSSRGVLVTLLFILLAFGIGRQGPLRGPDGIGILIGLSIVTLGSGFAALIDDGTAVASSNLQRFLVAFPMAMAVGYVIASTEGMRDFISRTITTVGGITAALAVVEFLAGQSLFGRTTVFEWLARDGASRALLGAEHSLVLGVFLAAAIPPALNTTRGPARWWLTVLLFLGVLATDSRGAIALALVMTLFFANKRFVDFFRHRERLILVLCGLAVIVLWYFAQNIWNAATYSEDWSANSIEYRGAIYSLLPDILSQAPHGYGWATLPSSVWQIQAPDRIIDITRSVDSQIVLSALRMGWLGVALFLGTVLLGVLALKQRPDLAAAFLLTTVSGSFLAIDAWDGFGIFWSLQLGIVTRIVVERHHNSKVDTHGTAFRTSVNHV